MCTSSGGSVYFTAQYALTWAVCDSLSWIQQKHQLNLAEGKSDSPIEKTTKPYHW